MKLTNWSFPLAALIACFGVTRPAQADLLLSAQSVTAAPGTVNDTFQVYATNIGASAVEVSAFNFEIATSSTDIVFQQSSTTTGFPYIFAGNSLADLLFAGLNSTNGPGQTLDVSDLAFLPNSFNVINPGEKFGLGEIFFDVAMNAPPQMAPVNFNTDFAATSVSDQNGNSIPLQFSNGQIALATVPEPSSGVLLLTGCAILLWKRRRRV